MRRITFIITVLIMSVTMIGGCGKSNKDEAGRDKDNGKIAAVDEGNFEMDDTGKIYMLTDKGNKAENITIPADCKEITAKFKGSKVKTVRFESDDTIVSFATFSGCPSLESIILPANMEVIESDLFLRCTGLQKIDIPDPVVEIEEAAFMSCENLREINIGSKLRVIGDSAFFGSGLEKITLPDTVETVGEKAFSYCNSLKEIKFNEGVKSIGEGAFRGCEVIEDIYLPESVEEIGNQAFDIFHVVNIHVKEGSYADKWIEEDEGIYINKIYY